MAGKVIADTWENGDGTENYKCRAWVNFNGEGTIAIRDSGNVSSITDNGVGLYYLNLINGMPDTNYLVISNGGDVTPFTNRNVFINGSAVSVSQCWLSSFSTLALDLDVVQVTIFR